MFVNIIEFPPVSQDEDAPFRDWFEWSNGIYAKFDGFISRRLLQDTSARGRYAAVVEHDSEATFMAMHVSEERQMVWERVQALLSEKPTPHFYTVVAAAHAPIAASPG